MADVTLEVGVQICFADHATDFSGGTAKTSLEQGTPSNAQIDLTSLADDTGRESVKVNLGLNRAPRYSVMASIESGATPMVAGERMDFYWAASPDATATDGNPGQIDGADAAAPSGVGTLDELLASCIFIGSLVVENTASTVQTGTVGILVPPERYGILIVVNRSGATLEADAVEHHIVFNPIIDDVATS